MSRNADFIYIGEVFPDPAFYSPPHRHLHHELVVILKGEVTLRTSTEEILAKSGDVLFFHKGLVHEEISHRQNPPHTLYTGFHAGKLSLPCRIHDTDGRIRQMMNWLHKDKRSNARPPHDCSLIRAILEELFRLERDPLDPWIVSIRDYLRVHFASALSLSSIAGHFEMTPSAFVKKFSRLSGQTPMKELRLLRLVEARRMIVTTNLPLKIVASAVGLGDEYQLSKLFRLHFGVPPRDMRSRSRILPDGQAR